MKNKRWYFILLFSLALGIAGCASLNSATVGTPKAVVVADDRIFTIKAGTEIDLGDGLVLDGKPIGKVAFPNDMKLTTADTLVKQELALNDAILKKTKADKSKNQWIGIMASIFGTLSAGTVIWMRTKNQILKG